MFKFKKDLVNSIVRRLNGDLDYKSLTEVQKSCLFRYYQNFRVKSYNVLGKHVKYKSNVLFHLLRLVGCDQNPDDFPLNGRVSNERTQTEIETAFKAMGWNYKPMRDYINDIILFITNLANNVPRFYHKSTSLTHECK